MCLVLSFDRHGEKNEEKLAYDLRSSSIRARCFGYFVFSERLDVVLV